MAHRLRSFKDAVRGLQRIGDTSFIEPVGPVRQVDRLGVEREAVELGLKTLIKLKQQEIIRQFRGKLTWQGDLDELRSDN